MRAYITTPEGVKDIVPRPPPDFKMEEIPMETERKTVGTIPAPVSTEARELAFVLSRNDADFTRAMLMRALALEKAIYGQRRARA